MAGIDFGHASNEGLNKGYFNQIVSSVPGSVAILQLEGFKILAINKQFENEFGYSVDELSNKEIRFN